MTLNCLYKISGDRFRIEHALHIYQNNCFLDYDYYSSKQLLPFDFARLVFQAAMLYVVLSWGPGHPVCM